MGSRDIVPESTVLVVVARSVTFSAPTVVAEQHPNRLCVDIRVLEYLVMAAAVNPLRPLLEANQLTSTRIKRTNVTSHAKIMRIMWLALKRKNR